MKERLFSFIATEEKGSVSAITQIPTGAKALFVIAHGAGANMRHQHMESISTSLLAQKIATFRFNFPYMEAGGKRTDSKPVCIETISNAVNLANTLAGDLPLFLGGHSFGGRMSSHAIDERNDYGEIFDRVRGLIYFSFPLHGSKKPAIKRADHLYSITLPMLFLSGTRDSLAEPQLLEDVTHQIPNAELHCLETADHGFKILKRSRQSAEDVYQEAARVAASFVNRIL
jgi:predicted alpha/beta-hydrolase family hydrolase